MTRRKILAAAALVLAVTGTAQGWLLTGNDHLDITTYDDEGGSLCDSSTVNIKAGGYVAGLCLQDASAATISGDGGGAFGVWSMGSSTVAISGGNVYEIVAEGASRVFISGGGVFELAAYETSYVDISGGYLGCLCPLNSSTVIFRGYDFRATAGLALDGENVLGSGILTGKWFDGTPWAIPITKACAAGRDFAPTATILAVSHAIPEPASLVLLGLGAAVLLGWTRPKSYGRVSENG